MIPLPGNGWRIVLVGVFVLSTRIADRRGSWSAGLQQARYRFCLAWLSLRMPLTRPSLRVPDRLIVAPTDLRATDPYIAEEILVGRFPLAGRVLSTDGESPFTLQLPSRGFAERLHSFSWLRHIRTDKTDPACANARTITASWIALHGKRISGIAWEPHVTAERLIAWLSHSTVLLQGSDSVFYRRFMKSLAYQAKYLRKIADYLPETETRLRLQIALAMAAIAMPSSPAAVRRQGLKLDRELERQILSDGGHASRNPRLVLDLLLDLLPLRQTYINLGHDIPQKLIPTIDRMYPALRFFRHQDGDLALFNGASATPATELLSVLRYDETSGKPFKALPHIHYHRLAAGDTTVIVDTGAPETDQAAHAAHAGCLAFEMSAGRHRYIINAGMPKFAGRSYRMLARATATHSTVTLSETSSSKLSKSPFGLSVMEPFNVTQCERSDDAQGNDWLSATHDGYLTQFGYLHSREVGMNVKGSKIKGHDRFHLPDGATRGANKELVAVARFHIHPSISLSRIDGETILMDAPDGDAWLFTAPGLAVEIEEDIFFADVSGVRETEQLTITFTLPMVSEIRWMLKRSE